VASRGWLSSERLNVKTVTTKAIWIAVKPQRRLISGNQLKATAVNARWGKCLSVRAARAGFWSPRRRLAAATTIIRL
jgi:hypothetical protein